MERLPTDGNRSEGRKILGEKKLSGQPGVKPDEIMILGLGTERVKKCIPPPTPYTFHSKAVVELMGP